MIDVIIDDVYFYKGKPYRIDNHSKMRIGGVWIDVIVYVCMYDNPEGKYWVREKKEFYKLFKTIE